MTKTKKKKILVESFLNTKFEHCEIWVKEENYDQSNGFFLHIKRYFLCDTEIIYQHKNPTEFKICFNNGFLRELSKWVPVKGKKQIFRDWFFSNYLPDFEFRDKIRL